MRRILAGLMLVAVLAMHGVPMLAADRSVPASDHVTAVAALADEAVAQDAAGSAVMPTMPSSDMSSQQAHGLPAMPGPGLHMHVWAACLAVLLAGLTLLSVVAPLRRAEMTPRGGATDRPRWSRGWALMPRPPDLSALCLLRV